MAEWFFDAPGNTHDFSDPKVWHSVMAKEASGIVRDLVAAIVGKQDPSTVTATEIAAHAPTLGYIDPTTALPEQAGHTTPISSWNAFPRAVKRRGPWAEFPSVEGDSDGSQRAAEHIGDEDHRPGQFVDRNDAVLHLPVRDRQDEYLEWTGRRDSEGKLSKAIFVAEGYDYFTSLFEHDEGRVLELYRDFTEDRTIRVDDLRAINGIYRRRADGSRITVAEPGAFNPRNRYNINPGIVHLSHRANSLSAEVNLAGVSAIMRLKGDGTTLVSGAGDEELLCCCEGGNPNRNSDPLISQQGYLQVKAGKRYTLANPVGLYISGLDTQRVFTKDGDPLTDDWLTVVRGEGFGDPATSRVLRLELAPPAGSKLTLEDLEVDGIPVRFVGQLAGLIGVHLFVTLWDRQGGGSGPSVACSGTCCRKDSTQHLVLSKGSCDSGYTGAFPDLLKGPQPAARGVGEGSAAAAVDIGHTALRR